ncbi:ATP-binding cassette domain-containing protein [Pseudoroseomonas wenyumeiae]
MPDLQPAPLILDIRSKRYRRAGYPATEALRDLRLAFPPGSVTAVLGPSGCGKTTALRILLGLDTAFEGEVRHRPDRIGVVFQEPRLLPWRSIEANLRLAATAAGRPHDQVAPLLERVGLGGWGSRFPGSCRSAWRGARPWHGLWWWNRNCWCWTNPSSPWMTPRRPGCASCWAN